MSQLVKLVDCNYIFVKLSSLLDEKREKAFIVSGVMREDKCIEVTEYFDLQENVHAYENDLMKINQAYFYATLKTFTKQKRIFMFIHSHPHESVGDLQFSAEDDNFYLSLLRTAKSLNYNMPLIFGVISKADMIFKGFNNDGVGISTSVLEGYENYSEERYNIEILYNPMFEKAVLYHKQTNEAKVVSKDSALEIKRWKAKYEDSKLTNLQKMAYHKIICDAFPYKQRIAKISEENYLKSNTLDNLQLMIQLGCNLNCKYCYAEAGTYLHNRNTVMTQNTAICILNSLIRSGITLIQNIFFFGGEPSVYPDVIKGVCDYCVELVNQKKLNRMPTFTMVTNAIAVDEELIKTIAKYGIKVTVSIDGPKEINDMLRVRKDGSGTFDCISRNIEKMRECHAAPVMLESTYTNQHEKCQITREDLRSWLQNEFGIQTVLIADCENDELEPNKKEGSVDDILNCIEKSIDENLNLPADIGKTILRIQRSLKNKIYVNNLYCTAGYQMLCITGNGDYYPCHRFLEKCDYKIGNILTDSKLQLREFVNKDSCKDCKNCWAREFCNECSWIIFSQGIDRSQCNELKRLVAYILVTLANLDKDQKELLYHNSSEFQKDIGK